MISISDNDSLIIEFLIKNYSKRYTIREIAINLKISPAGAHKSLKKLEEANIMKAEKLGTGLFYEVNFENRAAYHLAAFVISQTQEYELGELKEFVKAIIVDKKVLVVSDSTDHSKIKEDIIKIFGDKDIIIMAEDEFLLSMKRAEKDFTELVKGSIIYGEELIINAIRGYQ